MSNMRDRIGLTSRRHAEPWPAFGASVRLRMKPSVSMRFVLAPARPTKLEVPHRRIRSVVGDANENRVAGAAECAVREGVEMTAIRGIEDLGQTLFASSKVWQYGRALCACVVHGLIAPKNLEAARPGRCHAEYLFNSHNRCPWALPLEFSQKLLDRLRRAFDFNLQARQRISNPATKTQSRGQTVDRRAKSHALHRPMQRHTKTFSARCYGDRHLRPHHHIRPPRRYGMLQPIGPIAKANASP